MKVTFAAIISAIASCLVLLTGCETTDTKPAKPTEYTEMYVPKEDRIRVRLSAATARGQVNLSRYVYVFPPLKVDQNKQLIDKLVPQTREDGSLYWISSVQGAGAIKVSIEQSLRDQGYYPVTFNALENNTEDHRVMVMNPYYSGSLPAEDNPTGRVAYTRVTVATYPASLDPTGRIEVINQEAMSVYHQSDSHLSALNTAFDYSIRNIGANREWMMDLELME